MVVKRSWSYSHLSVHHDPDQYNRKVPSTSSAAGVRICVWSPQSSSDYWLSLSSASIHVPVNLSASLVSRTWSSTCECRYLVSLWTPNPCHQLVLLWSSAWIVANHAHRNSPIGISAVSSSSPEFNSMISDSLAFYLHVIKLSQAFATFLGLYHLSISFLSSQA